MRRALVALALAGGLGLTGCAPVVTVRPAPAATRVACAGIVVRLPPELGTAGKRETDAQGTAAWGFPASVILRCGVPPLGATTAPCFTVSGVDWVVLSRAGGRTLVQTFGRNPATDVRVDDRRTALSDVLPPLSASIAEAIPRTRASCSAAAPAGESPAPRP